MRTIHTFAILIAVSAITMLYAQDKNPVKKAAEAIDDPIIKEAAAAPVTKKTSTSDGETIETVVVAPTRKKQMTTSSIMKSGNRIGMKLGFDYVIGKNPGVVQAYGIEIPFADIAAVECLIGQNTVATTGTVPNTNLIARSSLNYLSISGINKFYITSVSLGIGLAYDKFIGGYAEQEIITGGNMFTKSVIGSSPDLLFVLLSAGYLQEIKDNIFVQPQLVFSYQVLPWNDRVMKLELSITLAFKM
ncbi:MAG: hypothetical protein HZC28_10490 [Spirochaetes bacterium]|nr:hypothetical protein [Spirochaetota bacterium]